MASDAGSDESTVAVYRYPANCGCGEQLMVSDETKREDFRQHWRENCTHPPRSISGGVQG